jgi:hypothetical protein
MTGSSQLVRDLAVEKYVQPALHAGKTGFSVPVRELHTELVARGFPPANVPQICSALQTRSFLRENGLEIEAIEGPPSKRSTTVVFRYRVAKPPANMGVSSSSFDAELTRKEKEDPSDRAVRLTEKLRGLLKEELAEYGGGEAFLRWIRSEDEDAA